MDKKCDKKTRSATQSATYKRGKEYSNRKIEESGTFKESKNEKESSTGRNIKENPQKIKSIYGPLKEQLQILVEYINILEMKASTECIAELSFVIKFLDNLKRHTEILLNCQAIKAGKNG